MQKANVSHRETKLDKRVRRRNYHVFVVRGRCIEGESFLVRCQCRSKEKSDEEAKRK
jgi:hypothetical protein